MLTEETIYLHGNLCREWSTKTIESTGKQVIENALAWQPTKDSETTSVDITVWEDREGKTDHFDAIIDETSKGSRVMVQGRFKARDYTAKDGTSKKGWNCSVWNIAKVIRPSMKKDPYQGATAIIDGRPVKSDEDWF